MRISDWSSDVCSSDLRGDDDSAVVGLGARVLRHGGHGDKAERKRQARGAGSQQPGGMAAMVLHGNTLLSRSVVGAGRAFLFMTKAYHDLPAPCQRGALPSRHSAGARDFCVTAVRCDGLTELGRAHVCTPV